MPGNKVQGGAAVQDAPGKCNAKKKSGGGVCGQAAGWGTDHPGSGRCKLHGGASTGPKTEEGKERVAANAIKHGGYVDKLLNGQELELYDLLYEHTIVQYELKRDNVMHMATLQRACMAYIKTIRMDQWELEEVFEGYSQDVANEKHNPGKPTHPIHNPKYTEILVPRNVYDKDGNVIRQEKGRLVRIRWAKNAPNWESHFQAYLKILGTDRSGEIKQKQESKTADKVVAALDWLWGKKSGEE